MVISLSNNLFIYSSVPLLLFFIISELIEFNINVNFSLYSSFVISIKELSSVKFVLKAPSKLFGSISLKLLVLLKSKLIFEFIKVDIFSRNIL